MELGSVAVPTKGDTRARSRVEGVGFEVHTRPRGYHIGWFGVIVMTAWTVRPNVVAVMWAS
jgi:hypothetical protein